jgi:hypothetical protein
LVLGCEDAEGESDSFPDSAHDYDPAETFLVDEGLGDVSNASQAEEHSKEDGGGEGRTVEEVGVGVMGVDAFSHFDGRATGAAGVS